MEFKPFPKIRRIFKDSMIITEKLDGTNAQVLIEKIECQNPLSDFKETTALVENEEGRFLIYAGSRNRYITPEKDNYGFAGWVSRNAEDLVKLGEGQHFGEWWGNGIQRGYGLKEKRFSLFNTSRWSGNNAALRPNCCDVVPVLGCWTMDTSKIKEVLSDLVKSGSVAAPGFMDIEGIVVYHPASNGLFKYTVDGDNHKDAPEEHQS